MTIKSSGQLSLGEIMNEFGWPAVGDRRLGRFYRGGGLVPNSSNNNAISTSGFISIGMFYGASNYPPAGQLLLQYCSGFNLYGRYTNGSGGTYDALIQANSGTCGYTPISRVVFNEVFSLDAGMEFWFYLTTNRIDIRYQYFNGNGTTPGSVWNYTTAENTGSWIVDAEGNTVGDGHEIILDSSGLYSSVYDGRNYVWRHGYDTHIPNVEKYGNLNMSIGIAGRGILMAVTQPSAANGYVGYVYVHDTGKSSGATALAVTINAS